MFSTSNPLQAEEMVTFRHYILLSSLFISQFSSSVAFIKAPPLPSACDRSCGPNSVPYPFGFSAGCQIQLNCSSAGEMQIGEYRVNNVTADFIFVDVPFDCKRPVDAVRALFGSNYAMTASNFFFLRSCNSSDSNKSTCQISTQTLYKRLSKNESSCKTGDDVRCIALGGSDEMVLKMEDVVNTSRRCKHLFTSFRYGPTESEELSLVFGSAKLAWWLSGTSCKCSAHANYKRVNTTIRGQEGCKCTCVPGFSGDGFIDGQGCLKDDCKGVGDYMSGTCKNSFRVGLLVGGLIAAASLIFLLACLCHQVRLRYLDFRTHKATQRLLSERLTNTVVIYSYEDIEFATSNFAESHTLGTGAYGTVYLGRFPGDQLVAIKRLRHRGSNDNFAQVVNEIKLISSVSHPNLVQLLGCCIDKGEQILVYEFVPNGTLSQHLRRERGDGLPWLARVAILADTAKAIAYLHNSVHPPIYHRDIKSSNILLDEGLKPKLADFGLSRTGITESSHISTAPQGTPGYVDPLYHQEFHLSDKSDVYSFGVVLVEMVTAMKAVDFDRAPSEVNLASLAVDRIGKGMVEEIVDPLVLGAGSGDDGWTRASVHKVAELAFRCLTFDKDARPPMAEVAEELETIRAQAFEGMAQDGGWNEVAGATAKSDTATHVLGMPAEMAVVSPVSVQEQWDSDSRSASSSGPLRNLQHC